MILIDTSVWIGHFRKHNEKLADLLLNDQVQVHHFVIGELACGDLKQREEILDYLHNLPQATQASPAEIFHFIHMHQLYSKGLGFIDVHLLAATFLSKTKIWTLDLKLENQAKKLGVNF